MWVCWSLLESLVAFWHRVKPKKGCDSVTPEFHDVLDQAAKSSRWSEVPQRTSRRWSPRSSPFAPCFSLNSRVLFPKFAVFMLRRFLNDLKTDTNDTGRVFHPGVWRSSGF